MIRPLATNHDATSPVVAAMAITAEDIACVSQFDWDGYWMDVELFDSGHV